MTSDQRNCPLTWPSFLTMTAPEMARVWRAMAVEAAARALNMRHTPRPAPHVVEDGENILFL